MGGGPSSVLTFHLVVPITSRYFVSVAVFAKMNATTEGYYCNIDVYQLYSEAQRMNVRHPVTTTALVCMYAHC